MPILSDSFSDEEKIVSRDWLKVREYVNRVFNKKPDLNAILFLIGLNELGIIKSEWSKEEKQDLMHVGLCTIFLKDSYFKFIGNDQDGWPHFEKAGDIDVGNLRQQEFLIKSRAIRYFKEKSLIQ